MSDIDEPIVEGEGCVTCHSCNRTYERIGYHWSNGSCEYPAIPDRKASIVMGLMLGDGTLRTQTSNPFVQTYMVNKQFLEWVDNELAWLSTGVSLYRTAEDSARISRNNGHSDAEASNYNDVYVMQTRTMPQFSRYESWYDSGTYKRFEKNLVLDSLEAKIWYACDGSMNWDRRYPGSHPHATIGVKSEMDDIGNVKRMFSDSSLGVSPTADTNTVRFTVSQTQSLLDWMGLSPPGFEYKWETTSLDRYELLKERALSYE